MTEAELEAIGSRLERGCPTQGVTLSPWGAQLQADAFALYRELLSRNTSSRPASARDSE